MVLKKAKRLDLLCNHGYLEFKTSCEVDPSSQKLRTAGSLIWGPFFVKPPPLSQVFFLYLFI